MVLSRCIAAAAALAGAAARAAPAPPDPEIGQMVADISIGRIQRSILVLASSSTRYSFSDPLPSGDGIGGAGAWIGAELGRISSASGGRLQVRTEEFPVGGPAKGRQAPAATLVNFVATLPGAGPEGSNRLILLSAHYDSIPPDGHGSVGADDDATGVAAVVAAARSLSTHSFGATLVFLLASGGEQGALGAAHWAEEARRRGADLEAVIDLDKIGYTGRAGGAHDRGEVRLFAGGAPESSDARRLAEAGGENDSPARSLARAVRDAAAAYVPDLRVRIIYRADRRGQYAGHRPFLERGYPAVRLGEAADDPGLHPDSPDFVDYGYVTEVARVAAAAAAELARAPAPPRGVELEAAPGGPATLRWKPSKDPAVAGYRAVWRDTLAPFWTGEEDFPGNVSEASLRGVSAEDCVFGLEAFDAAGHVSPAAFALPVR